MRQEPSKKVDSLAHSVIGAAIEVHRELGPGYVESVYQEALAFEFRAREIPFVAQMGFEVRYKDHPVGLGRIDFLVGDLIVVELKAVDAIHPVHRAQTLHYLRALSRPLGLILNFRTPLLKDGIERIVLSP
ncbi:MAG: GxxExxY protein [Myxococcota bacterium]